MNVFPDFGSLGGIGDLKVIIGAMLTIILVVAVLMIIMSAIVWAIASSTGNPGMSAKGCLEVTSESACVTIEKWSCKYRVALALIPA